MVAGIDHLERLLLWHASVILSNVLSSTAFDLLDADGP